MPASFNAAFQVAIKSSHCVTLCDAVRSGVPLNSQQICTRLNGVTDILSLRNRLHLESWRFHVLGREQKQSGVSEGAVS